jgi:hypothetical protein
VELTDEDEKLLRHIHQLTSEERDAYIRRSRKAVAPR